MVAYWCVVAFYILSFFLCLAGLFLFSASGKSRQWVNGKFEWFDLFIGALFAWLLYTVFQGNWNSIAILICLIWATRWTYGMYQIAAGRFVYASKYCMSMAVSLLQIILLFIYGWTI